MPLAPADGLPAAPVTVGTRGNEPQVVVGSDGTIYVGALQHVYVSTDDGATFRLANDILDHLSIASDSSLAFDPSGTLYYAADWPYAGQTEVCTSRDRAATWRCNYLALPGVTDRMWIVAPRDDVAYLVANEGLYQPTLMISKDAGLTWLPHAAGTTLFAPGTGPLLVPPGRTTPVLQPTGTGRELAFAEYGASPLGKVLRTGSPAPLALPSGAFSPDGVLWSATEVPQPGGGATLLVLRSDDLGRSWTTLPVPTPGAATVAFAWVAAGEPGDVGVIFYGSTTRGVPGSMPAAATWDAWYARTRDARSASPTWTLTLLEQGVHAGPVCVSAACSGRGRFAGDFITTTIDEQGRAHAVWMRDVPREEVRYARVP